MAANAAPSSAPPETEQTELQEAESQHKKRGKCMACIGKIWSIQNDEDKENDQEAFVKQTFKELVIYLVFLVFVCIISFKMASTNMYYYTKVMMDLFLHRDGGGEGVKFTDITSMKDFWNMAMFPLMSGLYWTEWYNSRDSHPVKGFIYYENKLLGPPRLRQIRVATNSCDVPLEFQPYIWDCYPAYQTSIEDTSNFGKKIINTTNPIDYQDAWVHKTAEQLDGFDFWGKISQYSGSGYAINLTMDKATTEPILKSLKSELWVRRGARAVLISFTVYNANINLFCVITLCVEFPATGGALPTYTFQTVKLMRYVNKEDYFVLACEVIFLLFITFYVIEEILEISQVGFEYFFDFWNVLDLLLIIMSLLCAGLNIVRVIKMADKIKCLKDQLKDESIHHNFEELGFMETRFNNCVAIMVFLAWVKVFKYISFNKTMIQLSTTLSRCAKDLAGFFIMFSIFFIAFTQLGYLLFGHDVHDFSTFLDSFFTLFRIILGDFDFKQLRRSNRVLGPLFFILFVFFVFFVLINMFLAIINDTYSEVKSDMAKQTDVFIMSDYIKQSYNRFVDKMVSTKEKLEGFEKILKTESSEKKLGFEEWKTELLKQGYEEEEIEAVFAKYDVDGDRTLDPTEQKKMLEELEKQKGLLKARDSKKDGGVTSFGEQDAEEDSDEENDAGQKDIISPDEFDGLLRRVDKMEGNLGGIISNIDAVLAQLRSLK